MRYQLRHNPRIPSRGLPITGFRTRTRTTWPSSSTVSARVALDLAAIHSLSPFAPMCEVPHLHVFSLATWPNPSVNTSVVSTSAPTERPVRGVRQAFCPVREGWFPPPTPCTDGSISFFSLGCPSTSPCSTPVPDDARPKPSSPFVSTSASCVVVPRFFWILGDISPQNPVPSGSFFDLYALEHGSHEHFDGVVERCSQSQRSMCPSFPQIHVHVPSLTEAANAPSFQWSCSWFQRS